MTVVGIDPSLEKTGIATAEGVTVIRPRTLLGMPRLNFIRDAVLNTMLSPSVRLVTIEGYSFGSVNRACAMGEIGGLIRYTVWQAGVPFFEIPPNTLKKFATGNGHAGKEQMVAAARERLGYRGYENNEADALWLRIAGLELIGEPCVALPKAQIAALDMLRKSRPIWGDGHPPVIDVETGELL